MSSPNASAESLPNGSVRSMSISSVSDSEHSAINTDAASDAALTFFQRETTVTGRHLPYRKPKHGEVPHRFQRVTRTTEVAIEEMASPPEELVVNKGADAAEEMHTDEQIAPQPQEVRSKFRRRLEVILRPFFEAPAATPQRNEERNALVRRIDDLIRPYWDAAERMRHSNAEPGPSNLKRRRSSSADDPIIISDDEGGKPKPKKRICGADRGDVDNLRGVFIESDSDDDDYMPTTPDAMSSPAVAA